MAPNEIKLDLYEEELVELGQIPASSSALTNGYDKIFETLIKDLTVLENEGINVEYKSKLVNLKGTISFICQDNLAGNSIGGFVESFGCNVGCK